MEKYKISIPHFYCLKYEDLITNKIMIIDIDLRDKYQVLSLDCLSHWNTPYENEILDKEIQLEIINNIYTFLCNKFGTKYVINTLDKYHRIRFFFRNPIYYFSKYLHKQYTKKLIQKKSQMVNMNLNQIFLHII